MALTCLFASTALTKYRQWHRAIRKREAWLRKWRRNLTIFGLLIVIGFVSIYLFRGIPRVAASAMRNAEMFELLSIDPEVGRKDADFHGYKSLGRTAITDPAIRRRLFASLQSGTRWSVPIPSMCFDPRHAIRVVADGRTVDLLICFECSQVKVWEGDKLVTTFLVGGSPESVFDQVLQQAGVPLAPK